MLAIFGFSTLQAQTESVGTVAFVIGKAEVIRNGKEFTARPGVKLQQSDILETGKKSTLVVELKAGSKLKLKESSRLAITKVTGRESTELRLDKGAVFSSVVKRQKDENFRISSPTATAAVRGTEFFFSYGKKKDLWLCVNEGNVAVLGTAEAAEKVVPAGEGVFIGRKGKVTDPEALEWTKQLNWNMDPESGKLEDKTDIKSAYKDLRKHNYD